MTDIRVIKTKTIDRPVLRDYQQQAVDAVLSCHAEGKRRVMMVMATGTGKCLAKGTPVLMSDWTTLPVECIMEGDTLLGPDSMPRRVLSTCRGSEMLYRVNPKKGDSYVVNESHILSLKLTRRGWRCDADSSKIVNLSVLDYLGESKFFKHRAKGYRVAIDAPYMDTPIEPYYLGLWLGDGTSSNTSITNVDDEVSVYLQEMASRIGLLYSRCMHVGRVDTQSITSGPGAGRNPLLDDMRSLGLIQNKHIPLCYIRNSRSVRLEVLAGIIDSDGYYTGGGFEVVQKNNRLSDDIAFLSRSLGMAAYVRQVRKKCTTTGAVGVYYKVSISGDLSVVPVKLKRKQAPPRLQKKDVLSTGISVEPVGIGDYYGFELDGDGLFLLGDLTVTHNTVAFADLIRRWPGEGTALVLAHRGELLEQAAEKIRSAMPDAAISVEKSEQSAYWGSDVIVASIQTLAVNGAKRAKMLAEKMDIDLVVYDECFPAGTRIDGRPIETLRSGDNVFSFSHLLGEVEARRVVRVFKSPACRMVRVSLVNGTSFVCTPNHPVYAASPDGRKQYLTASSLSCDNMVLSITNTHTNGGMDEDCFDEVPGVFEGCDVRREEGSGESKEGLRLLLGRVQEGSGRPDEFREDGSDQSEVCVGSNEEEEPDALGGGSEEAEHYSSGYGMEAASSGREWKRGTHIPETTSVFSGVGYGGRCSIGRGNGSVESFGGNWGGAPYMLQDRYCGADSEDRNRGGREISPISNKERARQEEVGCLNLVRVDRVEVLEPGSEGGFAGLYSDGFVYNLEVEGNHNYFAEGILVHNCHHSAAPGNKAALKALGCWDEGGPFLLGCTATPNRGDKKTLGRLFEAEAFNLGIRDAIAGGWLCPISAYRVETGTDLSDVGTTAGDFVQSQLSAAVNHRERSLMAVEYWQKLCPGRPTLVFCVDVAHATDTADLFCEKGVRAVAVSGKTDPEERAIILQSFRDGQIEVLTNCQLLTEGVDLPLVSCVIMLRPTKSSSLYSQAIGRGTRVCPGKDDLYIIDLVDNCRRNRLVTAPVIFGLPETMDVAGKRLDQVRDKVDASGLPPSRLEGLRSIDQLNHKCEEWDLFSNHELPDDIRKLTSRIWLPWRDGYRLVVAGVGEARILPDDLGRYTAEMIQGEKHLGSRTAESIEDAFRMADRAVERQWGKAADWTRTKAVWLKEPPSEKQLGFLRRSKVPEEMLQDITKGKASAMIESIIQRNHR